MTNFDAIIFDLDGTLWETVDAFQHAYYDAVKSLPMIKNPQTPQQLFEIMGVKMDQVANQLFSECDQESRIKIINQCLVEVCNYLQNHQPPLYPHVVETLTELAKDYRLFLLSNGPSLLVETFLDTTGLRDLFTDYSYEIIHQSKKERTLNLIKKHQLQNPLLVGDGDDDYQVSVELNIPFVYCTYGYYQLQHPDNLLDQYNYSIDSINQLLDLVKQFKIVDQIVANASYSQRLYQGDANIVLMKRPTGEWVFGFWKFSQNSENNHKLFDHLEQMVKINNQSKTSLIGPIDYCSWFGYRLALDHYQLNWFPDRLNDQQPVEFLKQRKYQISENYLSILTNIDPGLLNIAKKVKLDQGFHVIIVNEDYQRYLPDLYDIATNAFSDGYLYLPITFEAFASIYLTALKIDPDLIIIYHQDRPVGFSLSYLNPDHKYYISKTVAIIKEYQNKKIILKLIDEAYQIALNKGFNQFVCHYQHQRKNQLTRVWKANPQIIKNYGLFSKVIE